MILEKQIISETKRIFLNDSSLVSNKVVILDPGIIDDKKFKDSIILDRNRTILNEKIEKLLGDNKVPNSNFAVIGNRTFNMSSGGDDIEWSYFVDDYSYSNCLSSNINSRMMNFTLQNDIFNNQDFDHVQSMNSFIEYLNEFHKDYENYDFFNLISSYGDSLSNEKSCKIVKDQENIENSNDGQQKSNTYRRRKARSKGHKLRIENALQKVQIEFASQRVANSYAQHNIARIAYAKLTGKDLRHYPDDYMSLNLAHHSLIE